MIKNNKLIITVLIISIAVVVAGVLVYRNSGFNYTKSYEGMRLWDIIGSHTIKTLIATAIIAMYFGIKYRKQNSTKVMLATIISIIFVQAVAISLIILTRLPINQVFLPMLLTILITNILVLTNKFENA